MDDPILYGFTAIFLLGVPLVSWLLSKIKLKYIFIPTILSLVISFPIVFLLVIAPTMENGLILFYISMSLWTGGFFSIFINLFIYLKRKKRDH